MRLPKLPYYAKKNRRCNAATSMRQKLWQGMRILRRFDAPQLAAVAEAKPTSAKKLILALAKFGIVSADRNNRYKLLIDLGPHAPSLRGDKTLYDYNTKKIFTKTKEQT